MTPATTADQSDVRPGLRQRRRDELVAAVMTSARGQLAEQGAAHLSLRAVAREVGVAPSALYRYFPAREDLLTALIAQVYREVHDVLAAAVASALGDHAGDPLAAWVQATAAYRRWVMAHPHDFTLVYGTPVPGYAAPEAGTREVGRRAGEPLFRVLLAAVQHGAVDLEDAARTGGRLPAGLRGAMVERARAVGLELPDDAAAGLLASAVGVWASLQGLVAMELLGHLALVHPWGEEFFREQSAALFARALRPGPPRRGGPARS